MERDSSCQVLTEVWEALESIHPAGGQRSLAELGFITATSTDGAFLRVLLTVPAALCRDLARSELLTEVERAISEVPSLRGVHLDLKIYRPMHADADVPEHPHPHALCLSKAVEGMRYSGWELGGFQQHRFVTVLPEDVDSNDTVRVIVHARIEPGTNNSRQVTGSSLEAS
jgi:metal-sulfur cluster biosynthetic enzyme